MIVVAAALSRRIRPDRGAVTEQSALSPRMQNCARGDSGGKLEQSKIDLMRCGDTLVDGTVLRHLVILHQAEAPIDQGLFVFVG
jgi:hypothetical protein